MNECTLARPRALVAEDDRALADVIRLALSRGGFDVTVAHDGNKALQLVRAGQFDVICSDYQMPGMNGEQLFAAVRKDNLSTDVMLILCSARSYELDSERLRAELGLGAVLYKPFSLAELVAVARSGQASLSTS